jgi:integrase
VFCLFSQQKMRSKHTPTLHPVSDRLIHLRDSEVVLYRRENSGRWQARFKLSDHKWHRISTKHRDVSFAARVAVEAYDRARFLADAEFPITNKKFGAIATVVVEDLQARIKSGNGKVVFHTYVAAIQKYLLPFFKNYNIGSINYEALKKFDEWRTKEMGKKPRASTITNHNTALNRIFDYAVDMGYMGRQQVPSLRNDGSKGEARPAFTQAEFQSLVRYLKTWSKRGHQAKAREMRELLHDYVLILASTGMRHGTEAINLKWKHIHWITTDKQRYLQFMVKGKTGQRTLIARHDTQGHLERIQRRFEELKKYTFDELLKKNVDQYVFRLRNGEQCPNLAGTFRTLMKDSGLDKDKIGNKSRTLYSLRHTYAHFALLEDRMDHYALATQMGTSVKMIEQHYGHITPAHIAERIAGPRKAMDLAKPKQSRAGLI